jgi:aminoglycoside phosphotransferase (APT) family kinase protein
VFGLGSAAARKKFQEGSVILPAQQVKPAGIQGEILPLLRQFFGSQAQMTEVLILNQKSDYLVLLLQLTHPSQKIVMKLAGPTAPIAYSFDRAAVFFQLVNEHTDIPMPEVFAVDASYQTWPWRYIIKSWVPGEEWATVRQTLTQEDLSTAHGVIGKAIAQLHNIHFPTFGDIFPGGAIQTGQPLFQALRDRARSFIADPQYVEFFLSVLDHNANLFDNSNQASLCHEDLHQHNILFNLMQGQWHLATILDFDKAWAGPAESDLARLELWKGMTGKAFWDAYTLTAPVSPLYPQRRLVYQLLWCLEFAVPSPQHISDTLQICDALGVQLPKPFGS